MAKISAIVITLNEERNLERCLRSLDFVDEIVVVDSHSTDRTVEIAKKFEAKVIEQDFMGYGQQKNFAVTHATGDWVFWIDADEEVSPELKVSITEAINQDQVHLFKTDRLTYFCAKPIWHGGWYPDHVARLFKKGKAVFTEPEVHEELVLKEPGPTGLLKGYLHHYSFQTVESQVRTNVKYARLGAAKMKRPNLMAVLVRPFWKFIECYFFKLGFLDGRSGLLIAINASYSMFMKYSFAYMDLHD